jgi:sulfur relay (sulfurtransferase) complex TusBCD TusD component (DsrE family)
VRVKFLELCLVVCGALFVGSLPLSAQSSTVTLAWNASPTAGVAGYTVHYGTTSGSYLVVTNFGNQTSGTIQGLQGGQLYFFAVTARDASGSESLPSNEVSYQPTNGVIAPSVLLTSPLGGAGFLAPALVNLAATVTPNGHTITKVQFYNGASLLGEALTSPYTFSWLSVGAGNYSLSAQVVYDSGSSISSSPVSVSVTNPVPAITLTSPLAGAAFLAPATINLAASATANGHSLTKVQFYNGASLLGESTSAPYSFAWQSVAAGNYSLSAKLIYDSGSSLSSSPVSVSVTNPTPTVTMTSPLTGSSFVAPATVSLAAGVTANGHAITKVQFYNGATLLGEDTTAPYSFSWQNVSAGSYNVSATLIYDSGSSVGSSAVGLTVTNPPPTVAMTSPANGSSAVAPATINLAASVTANGHSVTKVQFYNGGTLLGEDTTAPYSFSWQNVSAGSYSVSATLIYDSGSSLASSPVTVTVTNPAPTIAMTSPSGGSAYLAPATVDLAATVTANGHSLTKVQFYNGATLLGEAAAAPYTFSWQNVGVGSYSVSATLIYDSGSSIGSSPISVLVTNVAPAPTITLTSPLTGNSSVAPATLTLAASVTANGHSLTKVQFYNGATLLGEDSTAPYSFSWQNVGAGSYSLSATLVYDSGSVDSPAVSVTVTNPAPTIAMTSPSGGNSYLAPATVGLAASVTANGHSLTKVQFYNGATLLGEAATAPYTFSWQNVSAGSYSLSATLIYDSGSAGSAAVNVTVTNAAPAITMTSPAPGSSFDAPATVSLGASVTANGHAITKVQFYNGASLLGESTSAPYSYSWQNVAVGSYSVSAKLIFDTSSSISSSAVSLTVTSSAPSVALSSPIAGASFASPAAISLAATVNPNGHAVTKVQFYYGSTLLGESSTAPYKFTWQNVGPGNFNFHAQMIYDSGIVNSASIGVAVTNPTPHITLTSPLAASYSAPANLNLAANVVSNGYLITAVEFYNGAALLGQVTAAPYTLVWSNVDAGDYTITARAIYNVGTTVDSAPVTVDVVQLPPPWQIAAVGNPGTSSAQALDSGVFTLTGAGNLSGIADNLSFVYQPLSGDGEIVVQLVDVGTNGPNANIGVMIRESLTPGSKYVFMGVSQKLGYRLQRRTTTGGKTAISTSGTATATNTWVRLVRTGNTLTGYKSTTGTTWTKVSAKSQVMATNIYFGLVVTSGATNAVNTSSFTNVIAVP